MFDDDQSYSQPASRVLQQSLSAVADARSAYYAGGTTTIPNTTSSRRQGERNAFEDDVSRMGGDDDRSPVGENTSDGDGSFGNRRSVHFDPSFLRTPNGGRQPPPQFNNSSAALDSGHRGFREVDEWGRSKVAGSSWGQQGTNRSLAGDGEDGTLCPDCQPFIGTLRVRLQAVEQTYTAEIATLKGALRESDTERQGLLTHAEVLEAENAELRSVMVSLEGRLAQALVELDDRQDETTLARHIRALSTTQVQSTLRVGSEQRGLDVSNLEVATRRLIASQESAHRFAAIGFFQKQQHDVASNLLIRKRQELALLSKGLYTFVRRLEGHIKDAAGDKKTSSGVASLCAEAVTFARNARSQYVYNRMPDGSDNGASSTRAYASSVMSESAMAPLPRWLASVTDSLGDALNDIESSDSDLENALDSLSRGHRNAVTEVSSARGTPSGGSDMLLAALQQAESVSRYAVVESALERRIQLISDHAMYLSQVLAKPKIVVTEALAERELAVLRRLLMTTKDELSEAREEIRRLEAFASTAAGDDDRKQLHSTIARLEEDASALKSKCVDSEAALDKARSELSALQNRWIQKERELLYKMSAYARGGPNPTIQTNFEASSSSSTTTLLPEIAAGGVGASMKDTPLAQVPSPSLTHAVNSSGDVAPRPKLQAVALLRPADEGSSLSTEENSPSSSPSEVPAMVSSNSAHSNKAAAASPPTNVPNHAQMGFITQYAALLTQQQALLQEFTRACNTAGESSTSGIDLTKFKGFAPRKGADAINDSNPAAIIQPLSVPDGTMSVSWPPPGAGDVNAGLRGESLSAMTLDPMSSHSQPPQPPSVPVMVGAHQDSSTSGSVDACRAIVGALKPSESISHGSQLSGFADKPQTPTGPPVVLDGTLPLQFTATGNLSMNSNASGGGGGTAMTSPFFGALPIGHQSSFSGHNHSLPGGMLPQGTLMDVFTNSRNMASSSFGGNGSGNAMRRFSIGTPPTAKWNSNTSPTKLPAHHNISPLSCVNNDNVDSTHELIQKVDRLLEFFFTPIAIGPQSSALTSLMQRSPPINRDLDTGKLATDPPAVGQTEWSSHGMLSATCTPGELPPPIIAPVATNAETEFSRTVAQLLRPHLQQSQSTIPPPPAAVDRQPEGAHPPHNPADIASIKLSLRNLAQSTTHGTNTITKRVKEIKEMLIMLAAPPEPYTTTAAAPPSTPPPQQLAKAPNPAPSTVASTAALAPQRRTTESYVMDDEPVNSIPVETPPATPPNAALTNTPKGATTSSGLPSFVRPTSDLHPRTVSMSFTSEASMALGNNANAAPRPSDLRPVSPGQFMSNSARSIASNSSFTSNAPLQLGHHPALLKPTEELNRSAWDEDDDDDDDVDAVNRSSKEQGEQPKQTTTTNLNLTTKLAAVVVPPTVIPTQKACSGPTSDVSSPTVRHHVDYQIGAHTSAATEQHRNSAKPLDDWDSSPSASMSPLRNTPVTGGSAGSPFQTAPATLPVSPTHSALAKEGVATQPQPGQQRPTPLSTSMENSDSKKSALARTGSSGNSPQAAASSPVVSRSQSPSFSGKVGTNPFSSESRRERGEKRSMVTINSPKHSTAPNKTSASAFTTASPSGGSSASNSPNSGSFYLDSPAAGSSTGGGGGGSARSSPPRIHRKASTTTVAPPATSVVPRPQASVPSPTQTFTTSSTKVTAPAGMFTSTKPRQQGVSFSSTHSGSSTVAKGAATMVVPRESSPRTGQPGGDTHVASYRDYLNRSGNSTMSARSPPTPASSSSPQRSGSAGAQSSTGPPSTSNAAKAQQYGARTISGFVHKSGSGGGGPLSSQSGGGSASSSTFNSPISTSQPLPSASSSRATVAPPKVKSFSVAALLSAPTDASDEEYQ